MLSLMETEGGRLGGLERVLSRLDLDTFKQGDMLFRTTESESMPSSTALYP